MKGEPNSIPRCSGPHQWHDTAGGRMCAACLVTAPADPIRPDTADDPKRQARGWHALNAARGDYEAARIAHGAATERLHAARLAFLGAETQAAQHDLWRGRWSRLSPTLPDAELGGLGTAPERNGALWRGWKAGRPMGDLCASSSLSALRVLEVVERIEGATMARRRGGDGTA